jgi:hypothetical protein
VSGSNLCNQTGVYGTKGFASPSNMPGARDCSIGLKDSSGNFWLFGGKGYYTGSFNDLWKYDGTNWTWMSGSTAYSQSGIYGIKGTASTSNTPGARYGSYGWIDSSGTIWIFGGFAFDSTGAVDVLNDFWKCYK